MFILNGIRICNPKICLLGIRVIENQQMQEEFAALRLFCLKARHEFPFVKVSPPVLYRKRRATLLTRDGEWAPRWCA